MELKKIFKKRPSNRKRLSDNATEGLIPLLDYIDTQLIVMTNYLLTSEFERLLNKIWHVILQVIENAIVPNSPKDILAAEQITLIQELHTALKVYFNGEGSGIKESVLQADIDAQLQLVGDLSKPTQDLIQMHKEKKNPLYKRILALRTHDQNAMDYYLGPKTQHITNAFEN